MTFVQRTAAAAAALIAASLATSAHAGPVTYHVTDLGPNFVNAVNNAGTGAGQSGTVAALFDKYGGVTPIGTLGGASAAAQAVNAAGVVVGGSSTAGGTQHAFSYADGVMTDLGTLGTRANAWSIALDVNKTGTAVGYGSAKKTDAVHAVRWKHGLGTDLGTLPGSTDSQAYAINAAGHIAGASGGAAVIWRDGQISALPDLGGGASARAINAGDIVVGWCMTRSGQGLWQACRWDAAGVHALGVARATDTNSVAVAVNVHGIAVGTSALDQSDDLQSVAFVHDGKTMADLNTRLDASGAGWTLLEATDINDEGEIVGFGWVGTDTHLHAFRASPN